MVLIILVPGYYLFTLGLTSVLRYTCDVNQGEKMKVRSIQRSGTEAIKTQIQPSKPKREITQNNK